MAICTSCTTPAPSTNPQASHAPALPAPVGPSSMTTRWRWGLLPMARMCMSYTAPAPSLSRPVWLAQATHALDGCNWMATPLPPRSPPEQVNSTNSTDYGNFNPAELNSPGPPGELKDVLVANAIRRLSEKRETLLLSAPSRMPTRP